MEIEKKVVLNIKRWKLLFCFVNIMNYWFFCDGRIYVWYLFGVEKIVINKYFFWLKKKKSKIWLEEEEIRVLFCFFVLFIVIKKNKGY